MIDEPSEMEERDNETETLNAAKEDEDPNKKKKKSPKNKPKEAPTGVLEAGMIPNIQPRMASKSEVVINNAPLVEEEEHKFMEGIEEHEKLRLALEENDDSTPELI